MWDIHTMECYTAIKRTELLIRATNMDPDQLLDHSAYPSSFMWPAI